MKLEQSFEVAAPLERVWQALIDIERVAPCLPGAEVTGRNDDGSYNGSFKVKIGPTSAAYTGKLEMRDLDEQGHNATMLAQGTDKRGQGGAKATIVSKLSPAGDGTLVEVMTEYHITGRLARFGRGGMIEDISQRLLRNFADCLQKSLAGSDDGDAGAGAGPAPEGTPAGEDSPSAEGAGAATPDSPVTPAPARPAPVEAAEPVEGLSLLASVLWGRIKGSPAAAAGVVGFLLALVLLRRRS
jgi:carbon monoxide dehydrogenase subunit G